MDGTKPESLRSNFVALVSIALKALTERLGGSWTLGRGFLRKSFNPDSHRGIDSRNSRPPADARGDRFLRCQLLLTNALRRALDGIRGFEGFDPVCEFRDVWPIVVARLMRSRRKPSLELIAEVGQFGQIAIIEKGFAQPGLVIAELRLGDGEVLAEAGGFGFIAISQALQRVEHGTRSLMLP